MRAKTPEHDRFVMNVEVTGDVLKVVNRVSAKTRGYLPREEIVRALLTIGAESVTSIAQNDGSEWGEWPYVMEALSRAQRVAR